MEIFTNLPIAARCSAVYPPLCGKFLASRSKYLFLAPMRLRMHSEAPAALLMALSISGVFPSMSWLVTLAPCLGELSNFDTDFCR